MLSVERTNDENAATNHFSKKEGGKIGDFPINLSYFCQILMNLRFADLETEQRQPHVFQHSTQCRTKKKHQSSYRHKSVAQGNSDQTDGAAMQLTSLGSFRAPGIYQPLADEAGVVDEKTISLWQPTIFQLATRRHTSFTNIIARSR